MALMKKLTSAIVASSLVLGLVGTAGATTPDKVQNAAGRMHTLGLVQGVDQNGDLALNSNITRAQLVTILVRAFGQDANAKYLNGAPSFSDSANHPWASGYIALAKKLIEERSGGKEAVGYPDGTFNPDGNVTSAEAVAFLMKFLGVARDTTQSWPMDYINGAFNSGFITAEDKAVLEGIKDTPATRGLAFYLADSAFYSTKIAEGGTVYTTFVKNTKPVVTVDEYAHTTLESQVTLTGTVSTGVTAVYVGSMENAATLANGKFTATVNLTVGENNLTVTAVDLAGNTSSVAVKISHSVGDAASIEAADITVTAGASVDVAAAVKDAKGNVIAGAEVTGESAVGSFADGKFTAGEKAGSGTLTLKVGEVTKDVKVTVEAGALAKVEGEKSSAEPGKAVKLVAKDQYGNPVTGATFSQDSADAFLDANTGNFIGTKAGTYTVKATKGDITVEGTIGVFGDVSKLVIKAPETIVANKDTEYEVVVSAVDKAGNVVTTYDKTIVIDEYSGFEQRGVHPETKDGVAVFKFRATADLANSFIDIVAHENGKTSLKGEATIEIVEQVATSIGFDAPEYLPTNKNEKGQTVTLKVLDQLGKDMLKGSFDIDLAMTGPAKLEGGVKTDTVYFTDNNKTFEIFPDDRNGTGTVEITASAEGMKSAKVTIKAAYASDPTAITLKSNKETRTATAQADASIAKFDLALVDKSGVPVTDATTRQVKVKFDGVADKERVFVRESGGAWQSVKTDLIITVDDGQAKFEVYGNIAGAFTVSVTDQAAKLKSSNGVKLTINANDPAVVAFGFGQQLAKNDSKASVDVVAQVYDQFGNPAKVAGVPLTFDLVDEDDYDDATLNGKEEAVTVRTDANGQSKVTVGLNNYSGASGVTVFVTGRYGGKTVLDTYADHEVAWQGAGLALLHDEVLVKMGSTTTATSLKAEFGHMQGEPSKWVAKSTVDADADIDLRVTATDARGRAVSGLKSSDIKVTASRSSVQKAFNKGDFEFEEIGETGVYEVKNFSNDESGSVTFTFEIAGAGGVVKTTRSLTINALTAVKFDVDEAVDGNIYVESGKATPFTLELLDTHDNVGSAGTPIRIHFDVVLGRSTNAKSPALVIRDSSGAVVNYIDMPKGRNTVKFYVETNTENSVITLSGMEINKVGGSETEASFGQEVDITVNPTAK